MAANYDSERITFTITVEVFWEKEVPQGRTAAVDVARKVLFTPRVITEQTTYGPVKVAIPPIDKR